MYKTFEELLTECSYQNAWALREIIRAAAGPFFSTQEFQMGLMFRTVKDSEMFDFPYNVFIIGDKYFGLAVALECFFRMHTNAKVVGSTLDYTQALKQLKGEKVDILIVAEYLQFKDNYDLITYLRTRTPSAMVVMWAYLDSYIEEICFKYQIGYSFDTHDPIPEFIKYMRLRWNGLISPKRPCIKITSTQP